MKWLKEKLDIGYDIEGQGSGPRKEVWEIPENVFKESLIFGLFTRMNMVEQIGSGINRMNKLMEEASLPLPEYRIKGMFTVIFQRPAKTSGKTSGKTTGETSVKTSEEILKLIKEKPQITIPEIAENLSRGTRSIELQLKILRETNKLERIGPAKGGYWKIIE